jgi:hypothetical protein
MDLQVNPKVMVSLNVYVRSETGYPVEFVADCDLETLAQPILASAVVSTQQANRARRR